MCLLHRQVCISDNLLRMLHTGCQGCSDCIMHVSVGYMSVSHVHCVYKVTSLRVLVLVFIYIYIYVVVLADVNIQFMNLIHTTTMLTAILGLKKYNMSLFFCVHLSLCSYQMYHLRNYVNEFSLQLMRCSRKPSTVFVWFVRCTCRVEIMNMEM